MCLTGVDYFSTLGYQPSIAVQSAGMLAPIATVVLIVVTLFGALPVYSYVAKKSFAGQGSIGMLAKLVTGWPGKLMVLVLLGFAATDFVITKTLSAADAAVHLVENPNWPWRPGEEPNAGLGQQIGVTMALLVLLGAMFMRGFKEVIGLAVTIVGTYLALNVVVIGCGLKYLFEHPTKLTDYVTRLHDGHWHLAHNPLGAAGGGPWTMLAVALLLFPKLALGLSGFETGVAVMAHVRGRATDTAADPVGRIANTKRLLITAAVVMSLLLFGSSVVVSTLIDPTEITPVSADGGLPLNDAGQPITEVENWPKRPAAGRALAFLAHGENATARDVCPFFGPTFGTIYDASTIVILWFAGASAMAGLLNLVPKYLPKFGMAPEWAQATRPLVLLFTGVNMLVTIIFKANVDAQGGAYATGVLVLMTSACFATVIDKWHQRTGAWYRRLPWPFALITLIFVYTTVANEIEKHFQGLTIATFFISTILITSLVSRLVRSRELRFTRFQMADTETRLMWDSIREMDTTVLVPHRPGRRTLAEKERAIRQEHRIPRDLMIVFIEVELNDASDFAPEPVMKVQQEEGRYVIDITGAASISHTLAAVSLEMAKVGRPPEIHFGWTDESPVSGTLGFLLFGEGNVPWMVRDLIKRAEPDPTKRPRIIIAGL
ncbi:amino acid transporter [Limnoglobus roseus]|uniref:Amino acid transporter n=2 Tax=Limnoglobus roseus TaxID=2598579 RepID=A0A5C1AMZ2_9BACT|nr:amino acid transporter [Limnoglobus roseus]